MSCSANEETNEKDHLFGGPGIGKSTAAWTAAAWLKKRGASVELANEFVKRWAWQGREIKPVDEPVISGQQLAEEADLLGRVDFIVTEKPILLGLTYCRLYQPPEITRAVEETIATCYAHAASVGHQRVNVLLRRAAGNYDTRGRYENRVQAELIDCIAEQVLGELTCGPVYFADRNSIPAFLASFYNAKTRRP